ncbi:FapA family protein [Pseudogracilibacillus sp. SE30717A]|uniref:DUF342 domain-containing protein n=1 Tax=Pseudogracilibacillus sp. SE30717A TaxID=3098293 RepID=UPI00300E000B
MTVLNKFFYTKIASDQMSAELWYNEEKIVDLLQLEIAEEELIEFLNEQHIQFGIIEEEKNKLVSKVSLTDFPIKIAIGQQPKNGTDGQIKYEFDMSTEVKRTDEWDFREVMRIPTVEKEDKLATIIPPTDGENGRNVRGKEILSKPGKPVFLRAGKNVEFNEQDQSYYATERGQVNINSKSIYVETVYEIFEDISMKTGNIDFVGTVVIRGNVPTGFTIKAAGDIKIFGLVEAANIIAGGSVFISEGMAGLKSGLIEAGKDVHIGYVNQGNIISGGNIFVDNSILHSDCNAAKTIVCKNGNIIGGVSHAGEMIKVKDVGNRMNTLTILSFGLDKKSEVKLQQLESKKEELLPNIDKLNFLIDNIEKSPPDHMKKSTITLLKLKNALNKSHEQLDLIEQRISELNDTIANAADASLRVKGTIYSNVIVTFGKYKRKIDQNYVFVTIKLNKNEVSIVPH